MRSIELADLATLLKNRNAIDDRISKVIHQPMTPGHAGESIASKIFDIKLEEGAAHPAFDGRFQSGQLAGKTVNVKWYLRQEGVLDMTTSPTLDLLGHDPGPGSPPPPTPGRDHFRVCADRQLGSTRICGMYGIGERREARSAFAGSCGWGTGDLLDMIVDTVDQHRRYLFGTTPGQRLPGRILNGGHADRRIFGEY